MSTPPSAPVIRNAPAASANTLEFFWYAPASQGSAPITNYRLTLQPGNLVYYPGPNQNYILIDGLTNAQTYQTTIEATNDNGLTYGPAAQFREFQPGSAPDYAPSTVSSFALETPGTAVVTWTPPPALPDATIFWYVVTTNSTNPADTVISTNGYALTESNVIIRGLNSNSTYSFNVRAVNCPGYGPIRLTNTIAWNQPFSPTQLSDLQLWLDAQDATTVTTTGANIITQLLDKSANSYSFINVSGYSYTTNSFNTSYPAFTGPGNNGNTLGSNGSFTMTNPNTIFFVGRNDKDNYSFIYNTPGNSHAIFKNFGATARYSMYAGTQIDNVSIAGTGKSNILISAVYNGAASAFIQNGSTITSNINPGTNNISGLVLGQWYIANDYAWGGAYCELLMYQQVLTPFNRQKVEGYLAWKWGLESNLPTTHPFRTAAPLSNTVFTPTLFSSLQLWLDGSDSTTINYVTGSTSNINTWSDKSGSNNTATTGTVKPYIALSNLNGLNTINMSNYPAYPGDYFLVNNNFNNTFITYVLLARVYSAGGGSTYGMIGTDTPGQYGRGIGIIGSGSTYNYRIISDDQFTTTTAPTPLGSWTVLSLVFDNTTTATFSLNGTTYSVSVGNATPNNTTGLKIGIWNINDGAILNTSMDVAEVLLYTQALSTQDRQTVEGYLAWKWGLQGQLPITHPYVITNPAAITTTIPIASSNLLIRLDATTYSGSGAWTNTGSLGTGWNASVENGSPSKNVAGNGVVLNGSTNFTFPNISAGNAWTASMWVKRTGNADNTDACYLTQIFTGIAINIWLRAGAVDGIRGGFFNGAYREGTTTTLTLNTWVYITATWDGSSIRTYVNGTLTNTTTLTGQTSSDGGNAYRIGRRWDNADYVRAEIGQLLIYNRAITASEVLQNYTATSSTFSV